MKELLRCPGTVHDTIQVLEKGNIRYMRFGDTGGWQGALRLNRANDPVFPYQRALQTCVDALFPTEGAFLAVGVGTGTALRSVRSLRPAFGLYGVDLDERVLDVAIGLFDAPPHTEATYWVGDGLRYLQAMPGQFASIFLDAYLSNRIYSPCLEPQVAEWLANALARDGVSFCNLIFQAPARGQMRRFLDAAKERFEEVILWPVGLPGTEQNVLGIFSQQRGAYRKLLDAILGDPGLAGLRGRWRASRIKLLETQ